ncbi:MAG: prepilin-type N-terminal cleavage/methylation domain-containing protein [Verrucomicrobiota bacterium]
MRSSSNKKQAYSESAFTLIEILVTVTIVAILAALALPALQRALQAGHTAESMSNLRQLAAANLAYAADHDGSFCPAQSPDNLLRWHGRRSSSGSPFDPTDGFLSPYLGRSRRVTTCPLFTDFVDTSASWELGAGGYGYNSAYIGGSYHSYFRPERVSNIPRATTTIMFTTSAFPSGGEVQEYAYTEPFRWIDPSGNLAGSLQPSTHFRANGKALVAWCDGRVTAEAPNSSGLDSHMIGWFGPEAENGYWNPRRSYSHRP